MSPLQQRYDVVIVGSGPGGSTLAYSLAQAGCRILLLEEGDYLQPDPARPEVTAIGMGELNRKGLRKYVGGPSKLYGAALYRLREIDFRATATETGESSAWPISYADLEPYYAQAERLYGVRGSPEGDPSEPPRSAPFPHGPIPHEPYVAEVVERIRAQGLPVSSIPKAVDYGPGGKCVLCATCDGFYCQRDAKFDAEVAVLRPALLTGRVQLLTRARCLKVFTTPDGRSATGILLEHEGAQHEVQAGVVALCAGVSQTPLILRRSRNEAHPEGIGNATGCLGRYLAGHTAGMLFPVRDLRKVPPLHQKTFAINAYYEPSADWPYPLGVIQASGQLPLWESVPGILRPFVKFLAQRSLVSFLMTEAVPTKDSGLRFDGDRIVGMRKPRANIQTYRKLREHAVRIFKGAGYKWVFSPKTPIALWHPVGTARFGTDPATSVLDPECRVHGMDNLYVADSCFLPSAGAVNTTLSVVAMSLRVADVIAQRPKVRSGHAA